jgi:hypothetical protein
MAILLDQVLAALFFFSPKQNILTSLLELLLKNWVSHLLQFLKPFTLPPFHGYKRFSKAVLSFHLKIIL